MMIDDDPTRPLFLQLTEVGTGKYLICRQSDISCLVIHEHGTQVIIGGLSIMVEETSEEILHDLNARVRA